MKKQFIAAGVVATIGITGLGAGVVNAATTTESSNPMSSLVDAVASKFNLDKSEVQAVFDEQRTAREAEQEANVTEKVQQLVSDSKITQAQADSINAKRAELKAKFEANRENEETLSNEDRKAAREANRTELNEWAADNNISKDYLRYVMGGGHHRLGERANEEMRPEIKDSVEN